MVTSGNDNRVVMWNTFTGSLKQIIVLPERNPGVYVTSVKILTKHQNYTMAVQSNGDTFLIRGDIII